MIRALSALAGWLGGLLVLLLGASCRIRVHDDPRPALRSAGRGYVYALLHAHQLSAVIANDEPRMRAMVSRSADGDLLTPLLRMRRVTAVRGSTRRRGRDKGGRAALAQLREGIEQRIPALLAVDGPQGPRGHVHRGIADLACETGQPVVIAAAIPNRRWLLKRTWDRMQIPRPFCRVDLRFASPIDPEGHDTESLRELVASSLAALERRWDPSEAGFSG